jgi:hypothetical protein
MYMLSPEQMGLEWFTEVYPCSFHKEHPGTQFPAPVSCGCGAAAGWRKKKDRIRVKAPSRKIAAPSDTAR